MRLTEILRHLPVFTPQARYGDPDILRSLNLQSLRGFRYFAAIGLGIYLAMAWIDIERFNVPSLITRIVIIIICPMLFYLISRSDGIRNIHRLNILFFIVVLAEIESQHLSTDAKFYGVHNWFAYPLIMIFSSLFFLGTPRQFAIIWFSVLIYYILRAYFFSPDIRDIQFTGEGMAMLMIFIYSAAVTVLSSFFNLFWFRIRYTTEFNTRSLRRANRELQELNEKKLQAERLRFAAEKKLAIARERQAVFTDMHDHLGARLLDISILAEKLNDNPDKPDSNIIELCEKIRATITKLRDQLNIVEDREMLEDDFLFGLNIILLRRYSTRNRLLEFVADAAANDEIFREDVNSSLRDDLLSTCFEISNNDLKYGKGTSRWQFSIQNDILSLLMQSGTDFAHRDDDSSGGKGTGNIKRRINDHGGHVTQGITDGVYSIQMELPLKN